MDLFLDALSISLAVVVAAVIYKVVVSCFGLNNKTVTHDFDKLDVNLNRFLDLSYTTQRGGLDDFEDSVELESADCGLKENEEA